MRIFAAGKRNVKLSDEALQFRIVDTTFTADSGEIIETAKVVWLDERINKDLDQLLDEANGGKDPKEWLRDHLSDGLEHTADEVYAAGKNAGFSSDQLFRAKDHIKVKVRRDGFGPKGKWQWQLPTTDAKPQKADNEWFERV